MILSQVTDSTLDFKVKMTPIDENPAYSQNLPTPINLKEDITVELSLLHKCGIITRLSVCKWESPIFAQRKLNGNVPLPEIYGTSAT